MDFVNRLKSFMNVESISSTQFADACKIPRPTLSQILSGRNKKISDEVIGKIHEAYPNLNVLWLLFGEGSMRVGENMKVSEPQKENFLDFYSHQKADNSPVNASDATNEPHFDFSSENSDEPSIFDFDPATPPKPAQISISDEKSDSATPPPRQVSISADASKSIVNITVFYSDNSFQTFLPAK